MQRPITVKLLKNKEKKHLESVVSKHGRIGSSKSPCLHKNTGKPSKTESTLLELWKAVKGLQ